MNAVQHIARSVETIAQQGTTPWYQLPESWAAIATFLAVIVAFFAVPVAHWWKKSKLRLSEEIIIRDSDNAVTRKQAIGIIPIRNDGTFIAKSVQAYIEKIYDNGIERKNILSLPLTWVQSTVNNEGSMIQDIYPKQTAYLKLFEHYIDLGMGFGFGNLHLVTKSVSGREIKSGNTKLEIKLYQESGQIMTIAAEIVWNNEERNGDVVDLDNRIEPTFSFTEI